MMTPRKSIIIALVIFIAAAVILIFESGKRELGTSGVLKIGVIAPLTGAASEYGVPTKNGLTLAQEEINREGGIGGKNIELIVEDDQCEPANAASAYQKLTTIENTRMIIGTICSSVTLALAPLAEKDRVLLVSSGSSNPNISQSGEYIFRTWPSDAEQGKFLADVVSRLGKQNVAVFFVNNDYGVGLKDAFTKNFKKEVVATESFSQDASDFRTQLIKIKSSNPDAVFLAAYAKEIGLVLKQAAELGLKGVQFFGGEGTKGQTVVQSAGKAAEGIIGTIPKTPDNEARSRFLKAYKERFGAEPGITADAAYDIPYLLREASKKCSDPSDTSCMKDALYGIDSFVGASGEIVFDRNGDVEKGYDLITVRNGQFEPYEL